MTVVSPVRGQVEGRHTKSGSCEDKHEVPERNGTQRRKLFLECQEESWEW